MELEFQKLNLQENDFLVIKVSKGDLTEDELKNRLFELRNDEFINYVEEKGHKVFLTYTGIDLQILRLEENDKVVAYVDVSPFRTIEEKEEYLSFVKFKMQGNISEDKLLLVPRDTNFTQLAVQTKEEE